MTDTRAGAAAPANLRDWPRHHADAGWSGGRADRCAGGHSDAGHSSAGHSGTGPSSSALSGTGHSGGRA
ncbi:hypothetical protein ACMX2H_06435 [Arthrobacter sulfonylureivorans]|uniref:hypothetical protein n=1 Tax=Arthrobacter sulfonylureivorans TaxID=2486855 RepID=UPI0039E553C9